MQSIASLCLSGPTQGSNSSCCNLSWLRAYLTLIATYTLTRNARKSPSSPAPRCRRSCIPLYPVLDPEATSLFRRSYKWKVWAEQLGWGVYDG
ncbi:uncharacterized protein K444DRAFT_612031 [Hyaloscypha bicolor E]|uniref:Uncharacterized protein n=1 Tax=Hyaloscypha bicolor E TaxID=1095630 RepID=A0A2J6TFJ4_9HELO|nr:uncharacterized protein K444DRAFT_612031 [Hyaloscypha bicolor E]PMD61801.1 hypothetical protein K444DRAFT_612031 [Hyaloscypha bicolor E]